MIPEELEKQIWQARKKVRGEREKRRKEKVCMSLGARERLPGRECKQSDPFLCGGQRREHARLKKGNFCTGALFPGAWLFEFCSFLDVLILGGQSL